MQSLEELYGMFVLYHGLEKASGLCSKPAEYLIQCAKSFFKNSESDLIGKGIQGIDPQVLKESLVKDFDCSPKLIEAIGIHLVNLEEEVPEKYPCELIKLKPMRKNKKKRGFNPEFHKKSILSNIKTTNYVWPILDTPENVSFHHIFKRKKREPQKT